MPNRVQTERAGIECRVSRVVKERFTLQLFRGTCPNEPAPMSLPQNASVWGFCLGLLFGALVKGHPALDSGSGLFETSCRCGRG